MAELRIELLGSPSLSIDGQPTPLSRNKSLALCAYLALQPGACRRDALATLLWPELGQARARADLRRELAHLREVFGPTRLLSDYDTIALRRDAALFVDVLAFRQLLGDVKASGALAVSGDSGALAKLAQGVALYRGAFLDGFTLRDAPEFDAWHYFTAEELRRELAWALATLFAAHRARNDLDAARTVAQRRVALDPLDESAHQALIELHLQAGNRSAALRQFEQSVRLLQQELDAPPGPALQSLGATIKQFVAAAAYAPVVASLPATAQPAPPAADDDAEMHAVVALSLSILPAAPGDQARLAHSPPRDAASVFASFLAGCQDRLQRAGATLLYSSTESILALFGLPISSEDDAERALDCVFALRAAAPADLAAAAGVAAGLAYVKPGELSAPGTVIGPVLNLAAALQRSAAAGEVLVDRATYLLTNGAVRYEEGETVTVHGRTVAAYCAQQRHMVAEKARGLAELRPPLIGRAQALARLQAALDRAARGEGQLVFLSGEAGLGKSRLVAELKAQWTGAADRWLAGRCRESTLAAGYWPFAEILRLHLGWRPGDTAATRVAALEAGLAAWRGLGTRDLVDWDEIAAVLGALFDVRFGDYRDDLLRHADPGQLHHRTLVALTALLLAIAHQPRRGALVLVLEDLHWADVSTLDLIRQLLAKVVAAPLLLLCVYRPEAREECVRLPALAARRAPDGVVEIQLHELTRDESLHLLDALFGHHRLPADLLDWMLERAQGNPFFIEETVRALIDAGVIAREAGVWRLARSGQQWDANQAGATTPGVDSLILSRVARLDADLRRVLQAASVLGTTFAFPLLADLLPGTTALAAHLRLLEQHDFLLCERMAPPPEYSFRHALLCDAIYKTLPTPQRIQLHRQAAKSIETHFAADLEAHVEQLAHHYVQTDDHAAAVHALVRAGARARRAFHNEQARTFFEAAIARTADLCPTGADQVTSQTVADIWLQLGRVHYAMSAFGEAERAFRMALAIGEASGWDVHTQVRTLYWLGEALYWEEQNAALEAVAIDGLARLGAADRSPERALMLGHLKVACSLLGRNDEAEQILMELMPLVQAAPFCEELAPAYHHIIDYFILEKEDARAAAYWIDEMRTRAATIHDLNSLAKALFIDATLRLACGDLAGSQAANQQAMTLLQQTNERTLAYYCLALLAETLLLRGELPEALRLTRELLAQLAADDYAEPQHEVRIEHILLGVGQIDSAIAMLQKSLASVTVAPDIKEWVRLMLARAYAAAGRGDDCAHLCQAALQRDSARFPVTTWGPLYHLQLTLVLAQLDAVSTDPAAFHAYCAEVQQQAPHLVALLPGPWALAPAQPWPMPRLVLEEHFTTAPDDRWQWIDPTGAGACATGPGLTLRAGEGCGLWHLNLLAPRLLTRIEGDFALQAICMPAGGAGLPLGGLCLWGDDTAFVHLGWGELGRGQLMLVGRIDNQDRAFGRGRLAAERITLRIERRGATVRGLCRADDERWWLVGACEWSWSGALASGPFVLGLVDRTIYPGAPAAGGALTFASVQLWR